MKVSINFEIDNDAYENMSEGIVFTLQHLVNRLREQSNNYLKGNGSRNYLKDSNGNTVGFFEILDIEETANEE